MKAKYLRFFCCILVICCLAGCSNKTEIHNNQPTETSLFAMNTYMDFTVYGENAHVALHEAENKVRKLEVLWSVTNTDSEVYQANHSGGKSVIVSDETVNALSQSLLWKCQRNKWCFRAYPLSGTYRLGIYHRYQTGSCSGTN